MVPKYEICGLDQQLRRNVFPNPRAPQHCAPWPCTHYTSGSLCTQASLPLLKSQSGHREGPSVHKADSSSSAGPWCPLSSPLGMCPFPLPTRSVSAHLTGASSSEAHLPHQGSLSCRPCAQLSLFSSASSGARGAPPGPHSRVGPAPSISTQHSAGQRPPGTAGGALSLRLCGRQATLRQWLAGLASRTPPLPWLTTSLWAPRWTGFGLSHFEPTLECCHALTSTDNVPWGYSPLSPQWPLLHLNFLQSSSLGSQPPEPACPQRLKNPKTQAVCLHNAVCLKRWPLLLKAYPIPQAPNLEMALPLGSPGTSSSQAHPDVHKSSLQLTLPLIKPTSLINVCPHSGLLYLLIIRTTVISPRRKTPALVWLKIQPGHQAHSCCFFGPRGAPWVGCHHLHFTNGEGED